MRCESGATRWRRAVPAVRPIRSWPRRTAGPVSRIRARGDWPRVTKVTLGPTSPLRCPSGREVFRQFEKVCSAYKECNWAPNRHGESVTYAHPLGRNCQAARLGAQIRPSPEIGTDLELANANSAAVNAALPEPIEKTSGVLMAQRNGLSIAKRRIDRREFLKQAAGTAALLAAA